MWFGRVEEAAATKREQLAAWIAAKWEAHHLRVDDFRMMECLGLMTSAMG
jgi:hypothetical protein